MTFKGCVAAVTGGAGGMGRELCKQLAEDGCEVAFCDVNEEGMKETMRICKAAASAKGHGDLKFSMKKVDVGKQAIMEEWAQEVIEQHGKVNFVFNNAGVALSALCEDVPMESFRWIFEINFWGVVYGCRAFIPHLKRLPAGVPAHIVNTSSIFGLIGVPRNGPYCATKFAVRGFTESLRQELDLSSDRHIDVSCVHPGGIKTDIARNARHTAKQIKLNVVEARLCGKKPGELVDASVVTGGFETLFITGADAAAKTILDGVRKKTYRIMVGPDAKLLNVLLRFFPGSWSAILKFAVTNPALLGLGVLSFIVLIVAVLRRFLFA